MTPNFQILPAILEQTAEACKDNIRVAETAAKWVQWDVMDGKFVPNTTWYEADTVKNWTIHAKIELDLMVEDPVSVIMRWQSIHAFRRAIWHIEADIDHGVLIEEVRAQGREVGLAISPGTSLMELTPYLDVIDVVQVMGVKPGFSGQTLLPETTKTIEALRRMQPELPISVDGGVNAQTLLPLAKAGAERFCMNSAFYTHAFPRDFLRGQLERLSRLL
jgi:ribulose-phosphate 3-epimerase